MESYLVTLSVRNLKTIVLSSSFHIDVAFIHSSGIGAKVIK